MKKKRLIFATVVALSASMMMQSCIGSFALFNKVKSWNEHVGDKFVNEIVFVAMWILPVYELCFVADLFILNSIEFWSGNNPALAETKVIDGKDAQCLQRERLHHHQHDHQASNPFQLQRQGQFMVAGEQRSGGETVHLC